MATPLKLTGSMNWEAPIGPDGREALPHGERKTTMDETIRIEKTTLTETDRAFIATTVFDGIKYEYSFQLCPGCRGWVIWFRSTGKRGGVLHSQAVQNCACMLQAM